MAASANQTARGADVDGRRRASNCGDKAIVGQDVADQFRKRIRLASLERLGLDDQVVIARAARSRNQVDADRRWRRRVVRRRELVDDRLHAVRRVLRDLRVLRCLGGDDVADRYGHNELLLLGLRNGQYHSRSCWRKGCRRNGGDANSGAIGCVHHFDKIASYQRINLVK